MQTLKKLLADIPTFTIQNPMATPGENRGAQTKRGMKQKNQMGGRPIKGRDKFRKKWISLAKELHQSGKSYREIADLIEQKSGRKISHTSISRWFKL